MSTYFLSGSVVPKLVKVLVVMHMIRMNSSEQEREQAQQHNCGSSQYLGGFEVPAADHDWRRELWWWWSAIWTVIISVTATEKEDVLDTTVNGNVVL